jgi:hypothetical protein
MSLKIIDDEEEKKHFEMILRVFSSYERISFKLINNQEKQFSKINEKYLKYLPDLKKKFIALKNCISNNYNFILNIIIEHLDEEVRFFI